MSTSSSSSSSRQSLDPANTSTDLDFSFVSHGRPSIAPEMEEEHDLPTLDELTARKSALMRSDIVFDANDWLSLIDKYLVLGEVDASDEVIEPAVELCKYLQSRGAKTGPATLRLAKCNYLLGQFLEARRNLEESKLCLMDEKFEKEIQRFEMKLNRKIQKDGKTGLFIIGGVIAAIGLFWMYKKRNSSATAAIATATAAAATSVLNQSER